MITNIKLTVKGKKLKPGESFDAKELSRGERDFLLREGYIKEEPDAPKTKSTAKKADVKEDGENELS